MYEIDGIKTAMEDDYRDELTTSRSVYCKCGWSVPHSPHSEARAALRFHYQFCPQARLPGDTA